jgi:hypothetical protein
MLSRRPNFFRYDYIFWYSSAVFRIFSSSTARWDILTSCSNHTLKQHRDTLWLSNSTAINAMHDQLLEIKTALKIFEVSLDSETKSTARSLLKKINCKFVCNLCVWHKILQHVEVINIALQKKDMIIVVVCNLFNGAFSLSQTI